MVVEKLFKEKWVEKRPVYSFFLGIIFTLIAFGTASLLFRGARYQHMVGITTILFTVMFSIPGISRLFDIEEKLEAKGKKSFFKEHKESFDFFIYYFIGVFIVFFLISFLSPGLVMSERVLNLEFEHKVDVVDAGVESNLSIPLPDFVHQEKKFELFNYGVKSVFFNNLYVMVICFILSIIYSTGALFLIIFNASIWASKLVEVIRMKATGNIFSYATCNLSIISIHMIPEVTAYVLAAIGGGVLSKAFMKERIHSKRFYRVVKDSIILFGISVFVLLIAALLEEHVSKKIFFENLCSTTYMIILLAGIHIIMLVLLIAFERYRRIHHK